MPSAKCFKTLTGAARVCGVHSPIRNFLKPHYLQVRRVKIPTKGRKMTIGKEIPKNTRGGNSAFLLCLVSSISCLMACEVKNPTPTEVAASASAVQDVVVLLSDDKVRSDYVAMAEAGDGEAAVALALYFDAEKKSPESEHWFTVAGKNGHLPSLLNLGVILGEEGGVENCKRS
ncbi:sel1 repeat family protein, partial [Asticcacaulis biprosthecium]|uniref:sel1 repeat family protein n=1 Tax=Asticcacaulis biprosthecium TaxID=76891 RepID=UPI00145D4006